MFSYLCMKVMSFTSDLADNIVEFVKKVPLQQNTLL